MDTGAAAGAAAPQGNHSSQPLQRVHDMFIQFFIWVFLHIPVTGRLCAEKQVETLGSP